MTRRFTLLILLGLSLIRMYAHTCARAYTNTHVLHGCLIVKRFHKIFLFLVKKYR
jgi:hypothetical protein